MSSFRRSGWSAISGMNSAHSRLRPIAIWPTGRTIRILCSTSPAFASAQILLSGENFGCGSSRESAVWALAGFGFRCLIAPSFGDIFTNNAFQNGMLLIRLPKEQVERLAAELMISATPAMTVDLQTQTITAPSGAVTPFEVDAELREALLEGRDEIGMTLMREADIRAFQNRDRSARPWIYRTKPQSTRAV